MDTKLSPSLRSQLNIVDQVFFKKSLSSNDLQNYAKTMHNLTIKMTLTYLKFPAVLDIWSQYNNFYYRQFNILYGPLLREHIQTFGPNVATTAPSVVQAAPSSSQLPIAGSMVVSPPAPLVTALGPVTPSNANSITLTRAQPTIQPVTRAGSRAQLSNVGVAASVRRLN